MKVAVSDDRESSKLQYRRVRTDTVSFDLVVEWNQGIWLMHTESAFQFQGPTGDIDEPHQMKDWLDLKTHIWYLFTSRPSDRRGIVVTCSVHLSLTHLKNDNSITPWPRSWYIVWSCFREVKLNGQGHHKSEGVIGL